MLIQSRLVICRKWLMVAIAYYVTRASLIIYPLLARKLNKEELTDTDVDGFAYDPTIEYLQTGICAVTILLLVYTFKDKKNLHIVRWLLVL